MVKLGIEARVGAFVLGALTILVGFVLALGDIGLSGGTTVYADFAFTSGLQVGSPVMLSGIRVGKVNDLDLLGPSPAPPAAAPQKRLGQREPPLVRASLSIDPDASRLFGRDTLLHIGTQGVLGESYVEVSPGAGTPLSETESLRGVDAPRLHVMALQMSALLTAAGVLLGDPDEGADLGVVGGELAALLGRLNALVGEHEAELGRALGDMAAAAADFRALLAEVRAALKQGKPLEGLLEDGSAVAARIRSDLPEVLDRAKTSLTAMESLSRKADQALDAEAVGQILADVRRSTKQLDQIVGDLRIIAQAIRRGEGTLGGLVQDPQIYDDIKEMMRDLKQHPWKFLWRD